MVVYNPASDSDRAVLEAAIAAGAWAGSRLLNALNSTSRDDPSRERQRVSDQEVGALRGGHIPYYIFPHGMLDPYSLSLKALKKSVYLKFFEGPNIACAQRMIYTTSEEEKIMQNMGPLSGVRVIDLSERSPAASVASMVLGRLGAEVTLVDDASAAFAEARRIEAREDRLFVHPFDDPEVIAGQGTVALEILRQHPGPIDAVFVAIGGGGLVSGVAAYIKSVRPEIKVIGVQTTDSDAMVRSVDAGKRVTLSDVGLFSDGTAVKLVGEETFRLTRTLVDEFIRVDTDAACAAIKDIFDDTRSIVEPAGALGVAAIKQYVEQHKVRGQTFALDPGASRMARAECGSRPTGSRPAGRPASRTGRDRACPTG